MLNDHQPFACEHQPRTAPDVDQRLIWVLSRAAEEWGPLGVLRAALEMWPELRDPSLHARSSANVVEAVAR